MATSSSGVRVVAQTWQESAEWATGIRTATSKAFDGERENEAALATSTPLL